MKKSSLSSSLHNKNITTLDSFTNKPAEFGVWTQNIKVFIKMEKVSNNCPFSLVLIFLVVVFQLSFPQVSTMSCIEEERAALLKLKASFIDPNNNLASWKGANCCSWYRVDCNNVTGHVIQLNLWFNFYSLSSNRVDSSLLELKYLSYLDLSGNFFNYSPIPNWFEQLKNLKYLNLKNCSFYGPIPASLGNMSSIKSLDLSFNFLRGEIPTSFGKLSNLIELNLRENLLDGVIPESFGELRNLGLLDVSVNSLKGIVSEIHFANLSQLQAIYMTGNSLLSIEMKNNWNPPFQLTIFSVGSIKGFGSSEFPQWLQTQNEFIYLNLANTSISGPIPTWLRFQTSCILDLSYNQITGSLPMNIGDQMPNLRGLLISHNQVDGSLPPSICRLKQLEFLVLSENRLSGMFPSCLLTQKLTLLDLSSNKFSGVFPNSFFDLSSLEVMHLADNKFEGELPIVLRNCKSLSILDLQANLFSGNIPEWVGKSLENLQILNLRGNMFDGNIPSSLWHLPYLQVVDLAGNKLEGNIPQDLRNFSEMSPMSRYETGVICSYPDDPYAFCYANDVRQVIKSSDRNYSYLGLYSMVNIDLSNNGLVGFIPSELVTIKALVSLNLSHNNLSGTIPVDIGETKSLESLDLSFNQLYGSIPDSMSSLSSLGVLKLSNNNFSGRIPRGGHLSTFNDLSTYDDNPYLCGDPLPVRCLNEKPLEPPTGLVNYDTHNIQREEKQEKMWFYIVIMLGYAVGFWGVVGSLVVKKSWRDAYFGFMEETKDKIYATIWRL